jgi:ankyrin repeat protein
MDFNETVEFLRKATKEQKLCFVIKVGNTEVAKPLIHDLTIDVNKSHILSYAVKSDTTFFLEHLLARKDLDVNKTLNYLQETALHIAIVERKYKHVKLLLGDERVDAGKKGCKFNATPMFVACIKADPDMVKLLFESKKDLNLTSRTAFMIPQEVTAFEFVKIALDVNKNDLKRNMKYMKSTILDAETQDKMEKTAMIIKTQKECIKNLDRIFSLMSTELTRILTKFVVPVKDEVVKEKQEKVVV